MIDRGLLDMAVRRFPWRVNQCRRTHEYEWPALLDIAAIQLEYRLVIKELSKTTERQYKTHQAHFRAWCKERQIRTLPSLDRVAEFLLEWRTGPAVTHQRISAIAAMYRASGMMFDTKHHAIRAVMAAIRTKETAD